MNDPTTCEHPRFNEAEHELCPDCDEHANDVDGSRAVRRIAELTAQVEEKTRQVEALTKALDDFGHDPWRCKLALWRQKRREIVVSEPPACSCQIAAALAPPSAKGVA